MQSLHERDLFVLFFNFFFGPSKQVWKNVKLKLSAEEIHDKFHSVTITVSDWETE